MKRSTRAWLIGGIALCVIAGVAVAAWLWADAQPYPDERLATTDASRLRGTASDVSGIIQGVSVASSPGPWSATLDVVGSDGKTVQVSVNRFTKVSVPADVNRYPDAEPSDPFPYALVGFRLDSSAKRVGIGFLGLTRALVAQSATITHR